MEKKIIISLLVIFISIGAFAQKYAYVDSEYIMDNIPEYKDAQAELDDIAIEFKEEIEDEYEKLLEAKSQFEAEAVLMPEEVKTKKLQEIKEMEKAIKDLQKKYFGPKGELFVKREEIIQPIQEKIYNAIQEIAEDKNYAFVFDKGGSLSILYVQARYDISDDVLDKVGAVMGTTRRDERKKKGSNKSNSSRSSSPSSKKKSNNKPGKGMMPPSFGGRGK